MKRHFKIFLVIAFFSVLLTACDPIQALVDTVVGPVVDYYTPEKPVVGGDGEVSFSLKLDCEGDDKDAIYATYGGDYLQHNTRRHEIKVFGNEYYTINPANMEAVIVHTKASETYVEVPEDCDVFPSDDKLKFDITSEEIK